MDLVAQSPKGLFTCQYYPLWHFNHGFYLLPFAALCDDYDLPKGMPEIRMGNVFGPPMEITFEPWVKAWSQACTGINCDGLSRGFGNSVRILIPSVLLSITIASVNGYALSNWKFKGSEVFYHSNYWCIYPLSNNALSNCDIASGAWFNGLYWWLGARPYYFWHAHTNTVIPQLFCFHTSRVV